MAYNLGGMPREIILQVRMTDAERKELKALADKQGLSMSAYVRTLVKEKLDTKK